MFNEEQKVFCMLFALMFVFFVMLANMGCGGGQSSLSNENGIIALYNVPIDEEHFWDYVFMEYVKMFDTDGDDFLSEAEIAAVTVIDIKGDTNYESSSVSQGINSSAIIYSPLRGIEYFTALESLDCSGNSLTTLDVSKYIALVRLYCKKNQLTTLDLRSNKNISTIECDPNVTVLR